jgi:drug/metabolite transporter (DMT)-like permease
VTRWRRALPWIALIVVYFVWGSTYLGIRVAVATIPPYLMTGCRWVVAGCLLFAIQWLTRKRTRELPRRAEVGRAALTAVLLIVGGNGLLCVAEQHVESGTAALIIAGTPIWMVSIDSIFGRKAPTGSVIAGLLVGTAGTIVLVGNLSRGGDALFAFLILLASLSWALGSVYARGKPHRTFTASLEMLVGGAVSIAVGLAAGEWSHLKIAAISPASLWGMLWLITAGAMLGYSAYAYAVRTLPTATVATYAYVNPVVAVVLGTLILRERISGMLLAGGAAIVLSVVLILAGSRRTSEELAVSEN